MVWKQKFYLRSIKSIIFSYFTNGVWDHTNVGIQDHNLYRPVWLLWEYSVYQIAGEQPFIWHLSSLLLHAFNGMLLFYLAGLLFPASTRIARIITALLFLLLLRGGSAQEWKGRSAARRLRGGSHDDRNARRPGLRGLDPPEQRTSWQPDRAI